MSTCLHTLHVDLSTPSSDRSYPILIGRDLLADESIFADILEGRDVILVSNDVVAPIFAARVRGALGSRRRVTEVILRDGEANKTMAAVGDILDAALADRHERGAVMVALGGGVVGDITGFAAACYLRGIDFLQLPTTLLAQVDSSVGGKTGVNHPQGKNMIGAFHQPIAVLIDLQTLHSLPAREFSAGIAEVIKYGLISDIGFFDWLEQSASRLLAREESVLAEAIERSCAVKADVVSADEREGGVRAILNFGHTFGHAIEQVQGYGRWLHGEAVACGMVMAARVSAARGQVPRDFVDRLVALLGRFELPVTPPEDMSVADLMASMAGDKKVVEGRIRFILLAQPGNAVIVDDVSAAEIESACFDRANLD
ncbi:3-dehydroquinate synthase [Luminiphilus syltensis NOR5-1B]|uniref:3-dehydroquinate synthase n=1 Tax=Luminiphilus syltensis NOR5-1B TaxID=565045 RepID=B8KUU2_9GAMM|nr:3-dehydroquinate synthase [Luminiphilus syltensis]EED35042.1 3-dehydroquinate synthase [Luminiphilus syltensis NOR5-1B]